MFATHLCIRNLPAAAQSSLSPQPHLQTLGNICTTRIPLLPIPFFLTPSTTKPTPAPTANMPVVWNAETEAKVHSLPSSSSPLLNMPNVRLSKLTAPLAPRRHLQGLRRQGHGRADERARRAHGSGYASPPLLPLLAAPSPTSCFSPSLPTLVLATPHSRSCTPLGSIPTSVRRSEVSHGHY